MPGYQIALISALATIVAAAFGYLGTRAARRSSKEANNTENWAKMFAANEAQFNRLEAELGRANSRLDTLETKFERERREKYSALDYIRLLHRWIESKLPGVTPPPPPDNLREVL
ncbi:hypothetical protein GS474_16150 [Rhodococcus hoagii]|nr:hypothetical protein [Prescottella equi]NKR60261.1 hypothetical protein [Prescottella equi]